MKLVYSRQALADLDRIATYYAVNANAAVAEAIGQRIESVLERIAMAPESAPRVAQRSQVRVANVVRYPFRIFYRPHYDSIDILFIRHTSQRPL